MGFYYRTGLKGEGVMVCKTLSGLFVFVSLVATSDIGYAQNSDKSNESGSISEKCQDLITLGGICIGLSVDEAVAVLTEKGMKCLEEEWFDETYFACERESANIEVYSEEIKFNCSAFNVCSYEVDEIAQMLLDNTVTREMKGEKKFGNPLGTPNFWTYSYCGYGPKGDEICVIFEDYWLGGLKVVIEKGRLGDEMPSFE